MLTFAAEIQPLFILLFCLLFAEICLPVPIVELNVDAVVVRPKDENLCSNVTFHQILEDLIMNNYQTPLEITEGMCQLESIEQTSCKARGM